MVARSSACTHGSPLQLTPLTLALAERFFNPFLSFPPSDIDHVNNMAQTSGLIQQPYPDVGQLASPYEQQQPGQELNQYATLKAVGEQSSSRRSDAEKQARLCPPPPPENSKFL